MISQAPPNRPDSQSAAGQKRCKPQTICFKLLNYEAEVEKAFNHANDFGQAILSVFDHDYRDIEERILNFIDLVKKNVAFRGKRWFLTV